MIAHLMIEIGMCPLKNNHEKNNISEEKKLIELNAAVQMNLIYCENKKSTIKVDQLKNNDVRYISWNKPKSIAKNPDLILYNGTIERQGTGEGDHFFFENGGWGYIVENNLMGETMESMGVFLKLTKNGEEKLYTKMVDLKK